MFEYISKCSKTVIVTPKYGKTYRACKKLKSDEEEEKIYTKSISGNWITNKCF